MSRILNDCVHAWNFLHLCYCLGSCCDWATPKEERFGNLPKTLFLRKDEDLWGLVSSLSLVVLQWRRTMANDVQRWVRAMRPSNKE